MNVIIEKTKSELWKDCQTSRVEGCSKKTVYFHKLPIGGGLELTTDSQSKLLFVRNENNHYFFYSECANKKELIDIAYDILNNMLSDFDYSLYKSEAF